MLMDPFHQVVISQQNALIQTYHLSKAKSPLLPSPSSGGLPEKCVDTDPSPTKNKIMPITKLVIYTL